MMGDIAVEGEDMASLVVRQVRLPSSTVRQYLSQKISPFFWADGILKAEKS